MRHSGMSYLSGVPVPPLLTTHEAAYYLKVSTAQVQRWAQSGRLKSLRLSRHYRFDQRQLVEFLGAPENAPLFVRGVPLHTEPNLREETLDALERKLAANLQNRFLGHQPPGVPTTHREVTPQDAKKAGENLRRALTPGKYSK